MLQFGGKDSKRHFTVVMGGKEHGLYVSSTPSSAAKKAVTKLCTANKSKKVEFSIREITQGSKKKTYDPYSGHIEKLKEPIELKGRVIRYKPVAKLSGKLGAKKGGMNRNSAGPADESNNSNNYIFVNINWDEPEPNEKSVEIDNFYEKIEMLEKMSGDIFEIKQIFKDGDPRIIYLDIDVVDFKNILKNNSNYNEKLKTLIELLKYFKNEASSFPNYMNVKFNLISEQDYFTDEYNKFLTDLNDKLTLK